MRIASCTDVGPVRSENEDSHAAFGPEDGVYLLVVADGMGGHARGREASTLALETVRATFRAGQGDPLSRLVRGVESANRRVWERSRELGLDAQSGMGTTCTAVAILPDALAVAHVGDSRAYRFGRRPPELLTADHTVVADLVRSGEITAAQAEVHSYRHALTRAVGTTPEVEVDARSFPPLRRGERLLVCSDGLAPVPLDEIARAVGRLDPEAACRALVERAAQLGGTDNATAVLAAA